MFFADRAMDTGLLITAVLFLIAAGIVLWIASRQRKAIGLPAGRVIYSDTGQWSKVERPLYDPISGLTGRPDYLVKDGEYQIPIEVKSARSPAVPHDSHIFQLAAYCLLVERSTGKRPPYGILHYKNQSFQIEYSQTLQSALEELLQKIRAEGNKEEVNRSHNEPMRCARCGYRNICNQRL